MMIREMFSYFNSSKHKQNSKYPRFIENSRGRGYNRIAYIKNIFIVDLQMLQKTSFMKNTKILRIMKSYEMT